MARCLAVSPMTILLKHFKSIKNIKTATEAQLAEVVDKKTAGAVYEYVRSEEEKK